MEIARMAPASAGAGDADDVAVPVGEVADYAPAMRFREFGTAQDALIGSKGVRSSRLRFARARHLAPRRRIPCGTIPIMDAQAIGSSRRCSDCGSNYGTAGGPTQPTRAQRSLPARISSRERVAGRERLLALQFG